MYSKFWQDKVFQEKHLGNFLSLESSLSTLKKINLNFEYLLYTYYLRVRDQAILQLLGTDFPSVIGSKKHENLTSGIFSAIFDSMVLGYSGIDNSNI